MVPTAEDMDRCQSWSVVTTCAEPRRLVEAFAAHHVAAGAERVFVFLDDPADVVAATLHAHPRVTAIVCDDKYWATRQKGRPADHRSRQTHNAEIAARRLCTSEWIAHVDADEFLLARSGRSIGELLAEVPPNLDAVRVLPAERMFLDRYADGALSLDGVFKLRDATWNTYGRKVYDPDLASLFPNGFQGHVEGKSFRRTRRRDLHHNIHFVRKDGVDVPHHVMSQDDAVLLHLFPASYEDWRRKYERRLDPAYFATMPDRARAQYGIYRRTAEAGGEAALRALRAPQRPLGRPGGEAHRRGERLQAGRRPSRAGVEDLQAAAPVALR